MPLMTVCAPVNIQVHAFEGPRQLCSAGGLLVSSVLAFGSAVPFEMWRRRFSGSRDISTTTCLGHGLTIVTLGKVASVSTELETLTTLETTPAVDEGDHERFTHIVLEGYTPKNGDFVPLGNSVVEGMINSTAVRALCGKLWVPGRDPKKFPVCPTCKEIAEKLGWSVPG